MSKNGKKERVSRHKDIPTIATPKKTKAATLSRDWRTVFLASLRDNANIRLACQAAGIDRTTAYAHRKKDNEFALQWKVALCDSVDLLEGEARRRAFYGTEKPVFHQGREVGVIREYSDTLLIFLLKAHRPKKFRERYDMNMNIKITREMLIKKAQASGINNPLEDPGLAFLIDCVTAERNN